MGQMGRMGRADGANGADGAGGCRMGQMGRMGRADGANGADGGGRLVQNARARGRRCRSERSVGPSWKTLSSASCGTFHGSCSHERSGAGSRCGMSTCAVDSIQMRAAHGATAVSGRTFRWNGRALLMEVRTRTQAAPTSCRLLPAKHRALRGVSGSDALRATCAKPTRSDGREHGTDARASRVRSSTAMGALGKVTPPPRKRVVRRPACVRQASLDFSRHHRQEPSRTCPTRRPSAHSVCMSTRVHACGALGGLYTNAFVHSELSMLSQSHTHVQLEVFYSHGIKRSASGYSAYPSNRMRLPTPRGCDCRCRARASESAISVPARSPSTAPRIEVSLHAMYRIDERRSKPRPELYTPSKQI